MTNSNDAFTTQESGRYFDHAVAAEAGVRHHAVPSSRDSHTLENTRERAFQDANTFEARYAAVKRFGFLVAQANNAAFDALCEYLGALPPTQTLEDKSLRIEILAQLGTTSERQRELALILVEDLSRTASNPTTKCLALPAFPPP